MDKINLGFSIISASLNLLLKHKSNANDVSCAACSKVIASPFSLLFLKKRYVKQLL